MAADSSHFTLSDMYITSDCLKQHNIREWYKDSVIFVTGGTGFLGKALIEKILRTCDQVKAIYVLIRPKRGMSSEQRYKEFIRHQIFERLRKENRLALQKLICLSGDMAQPRLGLNDTDFELIVENTNIVFHSAATVKFNEPLKEAGNLNVCGTQRIMDLCSKMINIKSVIHVSTAYCNPGRRYVGENVYPPTPPLDKDTFIKCVNILPSEVLNSVLNEIKGLHPNTYTYTKSIAEQIVSECSHKFPVSIIRPSIVTAAIEEPYPGWVDNIQGITGIMMEIGRGAISSILCDRNLICDIVPVDIVVNTMICAAWKTNISHSHQVNVYNCTSGQINPILWREIGNLTQKWARKNPTTHVMLYPNFNFRTNHFIHAVHEIFYQFLPAFVIDLILKFQGSKPIMLKIAKKFKATCHAGKFFSLNEWIFGVENQIKLAKDVIAMNDAKHFYCDISNIDYNDYIRNYMFGIRKFVLRDGEESLPMARKKLNRIYWSTFAFKLVLMSLLVYAITKMWIL